MGNTVRTLAVGLLLSLMMAPQAVGQRVGGVPGSTRTRSGSLFPTRQRSLFSPPRPLPRSTLFPPAVPTTRTFTASRAFGSRGYGPGAGLFVQPAFVAVPTLSFNNLPPLAYPIGLSSAFPVYAHPIHLGYPVSPALTYPRWNSWGQVGYPGGAFPYIPTGPLLIGGAVAPAAVPLPLYPGGWNPGGWYPGGGYPGGWIPPLSPFPVGIVGVGAPVPVGGGLYGGIGLEGAGIVSPPLTNLGLAQYAPVSPGVSPYWTRYVSTPRLQIQITQVRQAIPDPSFFTPDWFIARPAAWCAPGCEGRTQPAPDWPALAGWCGLASAPVYFDYGNTLVYRGERVYDGAVETAKADEHAGRAMQLAQAGRGEEGAPEKEWKALGIYALVRGEETTSDHLFHLAINPDGVLRGNYHFTQTDTTLPVHGKVDVRTQKAAWTTGETTQPVFETGLFNLTKEGTPVLVHYGKENTQQWTLVRIPPPPAE